MYVLCRKKGPHLYTFYHALTMRLEIPIFSSPLSPPSLSFQGSVQRFPDSSPWLAFQSAEARGREPPLAQIVGLGWQQPPTSPPLPLINNRQLLSLLGNKKQRSPSSFPPSNTCPTSHSSPRPLHASSLSQRCFSHYISPFTALSLLNAVPLFPPLALLYNRCSNMAQALESKEMMEEEVGATAAATAAACGGMTILGAHGFLVVAWCRRQDHFPFNALKAMA